jgi:hypothetical protein
MIIEPILEWQRLQETPLVPLAIPPHFAVNPSSVLLRFGECVNALLRPIGQRRRHIDAIGGKRRVLITASRLLKFAQVTDCCVSLAWVVAWPTTVKIGQRSERGPVDGAAFLAARRFISVWKDHHFKSSSNCKKIDSDRSIWCP